MPVNVIPFEKKEEKKSFRKYLGYKFFKQVGENSFDIVRVVKTDDKKFPKITIMNEDKTKKEIDYHDLKEYTPLDPYGMVSFSICKVYEDYANKKGARKDVMVMMYRKLDLQLDSWEPFAICRQSVNDFFAEFILDNPLDNNYVGICVNRDNCPANMEYGLLATCDELLRCDVVSVYKDDTTESILDCIDTTAFDKVLNKLYEEHCKFTDDPSASFKNKHFGWCRKLEGLLEDNNFMADFNLMCNITGVDFDMYKILDEVEDNLYELTEIGRYFFSSVFKIKFTKSRVVKFDYSVDTSEFNNYSYVMVRDENNNIFIVVYLIDGEFLEAELEEELNKLSVSDRLKLTYFEKYCREAGV